MKKKLSDRENLEWLVYWSLSQKDPCITIGRGKELLVFNTMDEMREWFWNAVNNKYKKEK